jgi:DNA processing protein
LGNEAKPNPEAQGPASPPALRKTKRAWLRLIRTPHIGGVTFWELLSHFGSAEAALDALPELAKHGSRISPGSIASDAAIDAELEKAQAGGMRLTAAGEPGYPPLLERVEAPPPLLYIKGDAAVWSRPPLAVVGARQATGAGLKFAADISAELVSWALSSCQDGARHRCGGTPGRPALRYLRRAAGGLDRIYPPEHTPLGTASREPACCR